MRVAKVMRHFWEEPVLADRAVGPRFFSGCTPRLPVLPECGHHAFLGGGETDASALRKMMEALIAQGAENIWRRPRSFCRRFSRR